MNPFLARFSVEGLCGLTAIGRKNTSFWCPWLSYLPLWAGLAKRPELEGGAGVFHLTRSILLEDDAGGGGARHRHGERREHHTPGAQRPRQLCLRKQPHPKRWHKMPSTYLRSRKLSWMSQQPTRPALQHGPRRSEWPSERRESVGQRRQRPNPPDPLA